MEFDYSLQPGLTRWKKNRINSRMPLVSVITPYYNGGKHICQTCNCVLDQTFPWFEWIIVNDGSTNAEDVALLPELEKLDPRIRVLHKENGGISSARNHGIRHAAADLILPLDGDDLLEPTFIEYCWWMLQKNPEAAWACTDCAGFQGQEYLWHKPYDPIEMKRENLLTATALIRKDVLLAIGGYAEVHKHYNEDWYAWLKIISRGGYPAQSSGEPLFWYRRNDTGVLSKVQTDRDIARKNRELIESVAAGIRNPAPGVMYPAPLTGEPVYPGLSSRAEPVYRNKDKQFLVFLLSGLEAGTEGKFAQELVSALDADRFDTGILTVGRGSHDRTQQFRQLTPDVFRLANFMAPEDYGEFVSYYLTGRQADCVAVSSSLRWMTPWLREQFPELVIVELAEGSGEVCPEAAGVPEKTYYPEDSDAAHQFAADMQRMPTDASMAAERQTQAEILKSRAPESARLYALGIQLYHREAFRKQQEAKKLLNRLRRSVTECGLRGTARKILRRVFRR